MQFEANGIALDILQQQYPGNRLSSTLFNSCILYRGIHPGQGPSDTRELAMLVLGSPVSVTCISDDWNG